MSRGQPALASASAVTSSASAMAGRLTLQRYQRISDRASLGRVGVDVAVRRCTGIRQVEVRARSRQPPPNHAAAALARAGVCSRRIQIPRGVVGRGRRICRRRHHGPSVRRREGTGVAAEAGRSVCARARIARRRLRLRPRETRGEQRERAQRREHHDETAHDAAHRSIRAKHHPCQSGRLDITRVSAPAAATMRARLAQWHRLARARAQYSNPLPPMNSRRIDVGGT